MNYLSGEKIKEIRDSVDIVDIISNYVSLTPKGKNYFGVCPFHDDNNPSMSVNRDKKIYKCFSCGATGTVFKFIMDYENISFIEAVKKVADTAGLNINIGNVPKVKNNNKLLEIYDLSLKFYINNINTSGGKEAKEYLKNRGITDEIIKEFQIGLALNGKDKLSQILLKKFNEKDIMKSGLVNKNAYGYLDLFYDRIMFPLYDLKGNVIAYSGRIYNKEDNSKYFNTKETEIFKKGELLYNYHRAKDIARQQNQIIVMEGFMDVIRAHTINIKNVVATMGTAVTKEQALLIKKMAKEIILCFDGDEAGAKATMACADELIKIGVTPKVIRLENNMDPDEYITKYNKEFEKKIMDKLSAGTMSSYVDKGKISKVTTSCGEESNKQTHNKADVLVGIDVNNMYDDAKYFVESTKVSKNIGRVYDFKITDCLDVNFKNVFRKSENGDVNDLRGIKYFSGLRRLLVYGGNGVQLGANQSNQNNIFDDRINTDTSVNSVVSKTIVPFGPYKHIDQNYAQAPKLGYRISFDLKTSGMYVKGGSTQRYIKITPSYYYISKDGRTFKENIELYYIFQIQIMQNFRQLYALLYQDYPKLLFH